jgi:hypothetical protein
MKPNMTVYILGIALVAGSVAHAASAKFNTRDVFGLEAGATDTNALSFSGTVDVFVLTGDTNLYGAGFDITLTGNGGTNDVEYKNSNNTYGVDPGAQGRFEHGEEMIWSFSNFTAPTNPAVSINFHKITEVALASVDASNQVDYFLTGDTAATGSWIAPSNGVNMDVSAENLRVEAGSIFTITNATADWMRINTDLLTFKTSYSIDTTPPETPYGAWTNLYQIGGTNAAYTADPDFDSVNNLMEYGLRGDPTNGTDAATILPTFGTSDLGGTNGFEYVYRRRLDRAARGLTYTLYATPDLTNLGWTNAGYYTESAGAIDADFESVTNRVTSPSALFTELQIEIN